MYTYFKKYIYKYIYKYISIYLYIYISVYLGGPMGSQGPYLWGPMGSQGPRGTWGGARVQVQFSKIILYLMTEHLQLVAQKTPNM